MLDAGALFGSDDLALGPYATGGLFAVGAGLRAVWTPWRRRYDHIGLDLRLIAGPREASAWAMLTFRRVQAAPSDGERMREREGICARLSGSFGVAVAGANRQDTWRGIGYSPVGYSGSPYLAIACEGGKHAGLFVGGETAPFVTSRFPGAFNKASPWFGTATVGAWLGGEAVRIGPFASVGSLIAGAGGRLVFSPWTTASGARAGVEARAIVFAPSSPAVAGTFAIYLAPDPRRPRAGAIE